MRVEDYVASFMSQQPMSHASGPLRGRILRGRTESDFFTLSDDPARRLVMVLGQDGLGQLIGKSGYQMLQCIGYTEAAIAQRVASGMQFKLLVFSNDSISKLATWHSVIEAVASTYPEIFEYAYRFSDELRTTPFAEIQRTAGYQFAEVEEAGISDPRYMTYDRLLKQQESLVALRAFLYHSVHLRELFRGDGFTDHLGQRGPAEYITPTVQISDLGNHALIDLQVILP